MNILQLLDEAATAGAGNDVMSKIVPILFVVIAVLLIIWFVFSNKKNKQIDKEYFESMEALRLGNKVKTTGGICGIVVEICDDNTVVIETGTEQSGKSYVKVDKASIAQTDAKGPTQIAREQAQAAKKKPAQKSEKAEAKAPKKAPAEEAEPAEEAAPSEEPATETPAAESGDVPAEPSEE